MTERNEIPDELIRKLLLMSFAARLDDREDEADAMKEAAETIGRLAAGQYPRAEALQVLAIEFLAFTEAARTLFIECNCVWKRPKGGGRDRPDLSSLEPSAARYVAELDAKIERARVLIGGR